jgi:putative transposase
MPDPTAPRERGKIERFFRTVRSQFLPELADELPLDEINRLFQHYVENGYHQRIHGGTGQKPLERYLQHAHALRKAPEKLA